MIKKTLFGAFALLATVIFWSGGVSATPEIARMEQKSCVTCHTAIGKPELNDRGKYYMLHGTLEGYPEPAPDSRPPAPPAPRR